MKFNFKKEYCVNDPEHGCMTKIIILILITIIAEAIIWWGMIRDESADWISGQIIHRPWPYAVSKLDDGRTVVGNVVDNFEIVVPSGWGMYREKHPAFYLSKDNLDVCEIKVSIESRENNIEIDDLLSGSKEYKKTYLGNFEAIEKESWDGENFIVNTKIPLEKKLVSYNLNAQKMYKNQCFGDFRKLKTSFIRYGENNGD